MRAEVLTYSRARGLFAGVTINGSTITADEDATRELYGRMVPFKTILTGAVATPSNGEPFVAAVRKAAGTQTSAAAPQAKSNVPVNPPPTSTAPAATPAPAADPAPSPTPTPGPGYISAGLRARSSDQQIDGTI
jgi:hypothetical protein